MIVYLVYTVSPGDRYDFEDAANSTIFASLDAAEAYRTELENDEERFYYKPEVHIAMKTIN